MNLGHLYRVCWLREKAGFTSLSSVSCSSIWLIISKFSGSILKVLSWFTINDCILCWTGDGCLVGGGKFEDVQASEARSCVTKWLTRRVIVMSQSHFRSHGHGRVEGPLSRSYFTHRIRCISGLSSPRNTLRMFLFVLIRGLNLPPM